MYKTASLQSFSRYSCCNIACCRLSLLYLSLLLKRIFKIVPVFVFLLLLTFCGSAEILSQSPLFSGEEFLFAEEETDADVQSKDCISYSLLHLGAGGSDDTDELPIDDAPEQFSTNLITPGIYICTKTLLIQQYHLYLLNSVHTPALYILYTQFKNPLV